MFILPKYAIKYISLRAPDFFDWGSGKIQIATERDLVEQEVFRLAWLDSDFEAYQRWTPQQRLERLAEIHTYLEETLDSEEKHDLYFEQALILSTNGDYEEAIASYDQALKIKPDNLDAWVNRGIDLRQLGRLEEAIASYDEALKIKPDEYDVWNNRGYALLKIGNYQEAIENIDQSLKINPNLWAYESKAYAYILLDKIDLVIENLRYAIAIDPSRKKAILNDPDFDKIRNDSRFINLINSQNQNL